ncbi:hypothetical protein A2954_06420 [Candidatus Roizmanbacteria bacterium RIFCSPLOWO2_01_FULL_37_12]|uniref:RiboL-PSP-HEPN domain-containing protein n=1 Tax=Candidatus Roizmanbacteria bacterium RIFCSPLOWO2_01_FULL_37_12 TaxID=1802056 RepID=A0A1F7IAU1_9BACT|nr:MAG: hypothetical protein A2768_01760 [Candidatus Roizmanbacteria bacterium RIFCSPHIGHO2_01_FULL_37_16]OGK25207.1 MAG: hypothetical protein A3D76_03245 [Candidatus Roizmanbacteria bacterium RIFCSPHIGHO2_02_FULL_37_9b]OGK40491.1 MAG: hypothetical protein A2954_06420 [Candidatus Roizmanbacteria bacterium RIFCSPLOWO2_01_FULL_37_12]
MSKFRKLEKSTIQKINQLQDFHVFTGFSYDRYEKMVKAGYEKGSVYNTRTDTSVKEIELSKILFTYLDRELPKIVIYQLVSYLDDFFIEFLGLLMLKQTINIENNFKDFRSKMNIANITPIDESSLIELRESRHIIAHRSGIADISYIKNAGSAARASLNNLLTFDRPYVYDSADFLKRIIHSLTKAAIDARYS